MVSVVNSMISCTSKHMKRINLTLNVLNIHRDKRENQDTFGGGECVDYLDVGDGIMGVHPHPNSLR